MSFTNVQIQSRFKLPGVKSFKDVADMLAHSRLYVCWVSAGIACGVYDNVLSYISKRK
jgi:alkylation response protein AidB-like acyl-CoA dehydrogenase